MCLYDIIFILNINTMDLNGLKDMAGGLMDKAESLVGKEKISEAKEWIESEKGKEMISSAKAKVEEFVSEKFSKKK